MDREHKNTKKEPSPTLATPHRSSLEHPVLAHTVVDELLYKWRRTINYTYQDCVFWFPPAKYISGSINSILGKRKHTSLRKDNRLLNEQQTAFAFIATRMDSASFLEGVCKTECVSFNKIISIFVYRVWESKNHASSNHFSMLLR